MIDLDPGSKAIIEELMAEYIEQGALYVFGSRVSGESEKLSDLDLLIRSEKPLSFSRFLKLKDALEFSELPVRVDLIDWKRISPEFRESIEKKCAQWQ